MRSAMYLHAGRGCGVTSRKPMAPVETVLLTRRIARLCGLFDQCLEASKDWSAFTGPSTHFYRRVLARRQAVPFSDLSADMLFLDYVYAALATWMGSLGPPLTDFNVPHDCASFYRRCSRLQPSKHP